MRSMAWSLTIVYKGFFGQKKDVSLYAVNKYLTYKQQKNTILIADTSPGTGSQYGWVPTNTTFQAADDQLLTNPSHGRRFNQHNSVSFTKITNLNYEDLPYNSNYPQLLYLHLSHLGTESYRSLYTQRYITSIYQLE